MTWRSHLTFHIHVEGLSPRFLRFNVLGTYSKADSDGFMCLLGFCVCKNTRRVCGSEYKMNISARENGSICCIVKHFTSEYWAKPMKPGVGKEYVNLLTEACKKKQYLLKRMSGMFETSVKYGTSFTGSDINMVFFTINLKPECQLSRSLIFYLCLKDLQRILLMMICFAFQLVFFLSFPSPTRSLPK